MGECRNISRCTFFEIKPENRIQELALSGFAKLYCRGAMQDQCIRKSVGYALGGPDKTPRNMMPNGHPLSGSSDSDWPAEVKAFLARRQRTARKTGSATRTAAMEKGTHV